MDKDGIDPDALEAAIESHHAARQQWRPTPLRPYWAMLYLVPQFQNPTGVCLSQGIQIRNDIINPLLCYFFREVCKDC